MLSLKAFNATSVDELFYISGGSGSGSSCGSSSSSSGSSSGKGSIGISKGSISRGYVAPATTTTSKGVATGQRA